MNPHLSRSTTGYKSPTIPNFPKKNMPDKSSIGQPQLKRGGLTKLFDTVEKKPQKSFRAPSFKMD